MRNVLWMTALMLMVAVPASADRDLTGSYVELVSPCEICANTTFTFTFYVTNASPDAEWLTIIEVDFPPGFTVIEGTDHYEPVGTPGETWAYDFTLAGAACAWVDADGGYGEMYGGESGYFTVNANTGDISEGVTLLWFLLGDEWGSPPHLVGGEIQLPLGGPSATDETTWSKLKTLYR